MDRRVFRTTTMCVYQGGVDVVRDSEVPHSNHHIISRLMMRLFLLPSRFHVPSQERFGADQLAMMNLRARKRRALAFVP